MGVSFMSHNTAPLVNSDDRACQSHSLLMQYLAALEKEETGAFAVIPAFLKIT